MNESWAGDNVEVGVLGRLLEAGWFGIIKDGRLSSFGDIIGDEGGCLGNLSSPASSKKLPGGRTGDPERGLVVDLLLH